MYKHDVNDWIRESDCKDRSYLMKRRFPIVYEKGKKNCGGFAPDVPGCISRGDTLDEIRANLREALQLYMDTTVELSYPVPEPTSNSVTLSIEGETDPSYLRSRTAHG